ncbi:MAG TPA: hypothetical protein VMU80_12590 [Bryobacteraceae bacterium]|nr:hypothetical protein [Bryobacteraceae bacterium]HUO30049.1 hypothetical protein [Bryobacteraceae bacterium]
MRLVLLFCLAPALCVAGTWTGTLVDSSCYEDLFNNRNPRDTLFYVDQDRNAEVSYCSPKVKTKHFGVLELDGTVLELDPAGTAKAVDLVRSAPKGTRKFYVKVTGELTRNTVKVDTIAIDK